jgi:hypothetical protein
VNREILLNLLNNISVISIIQGAALAAISVGMWTRVNPPLQKTGSA